MNAEPTAGDGDEWPEAVDALVAAPRHHAPILVSDEVRVPETRFPLREYTPLHTHRRPSVLSTGPVLRRDGHSRVTLETRGQPVPTPTAVSMTFPLGPHTLEDVETTRST